MMYMVQTTIIIIMLDKQYKQYIAEQKEMVLKNIK